jgi:hypothetical protein
MPESDANGSQAPASTGQTETAGTTQAARPEWAPEKFWDAEKGTLKSEELAREHAALGKRFAEGKAALVPEIRAELEAERRKAAPEKPDGYALAVPKQGVPDGLVLLDKPPGDGFKPEPGKKYFVLQQDHPLLGWWRETAHKAGLGQAEFEAGVLAFANAQAMRVPTEAQVKAEQQAFYDSLGEKGADRAAMLWGGLKTAIGEARAKALDSLITGKEQVEALEALVEKAGGPKFAGGAEAAGAGRPMTEAELRNKMREPGYRDGTDKALIQEVTEGFQRLYPDKRRTA